MRPGVLLQTGAEVCNVCSFCDDASLNGQFSFTHDYLCLLRLVSVADMLPEGISPLVLPLCNCTAPCPGGRIRSGLQNLIFILKNCSKEAGKLLKQLANSKVLVVILIYMVVSNACILCLRSLCAVWTWRDGLQRKWMVWFAVSMTG